MLLAIAAVVVLLAFAWVDGGVEPLRPIEQPVTAPGQGR